MICSDHMSIRYDCFLFVFILQKAIFYPSIHEKTESENRISIIAYIQKNAHDSICIYSKFSYIII